MCGLAAFIDPSISDQEVAVFRELMVVTSLRGMHSAGVACVYRPGYTDKDVGHMTRVAKVLGPVHNLLVSRSFNMACSNSSLGRMRSALFGHCRAATKGSLSAENAHPFVTDNLIGVHNGTITSGLEIPAGETDSQALFEAIDKEGVEMVLKRVVGAYALIWWDKRDSSINIIRNNERTLFYGRRNTSIVISSESHMLQFIGNRGVAIDGIRAFEPYVHYKKVIDGSYPSRLSDAKVWEETDLSKELKRSSGGTTYVGNFQERSEYWRRWWEGEDSADLKVNAWSSPFKKREETSHKNGLIDCRGSRVSAQPATVKRWLSVGCSVCGTVADLDDYTFWSTSRGGESPEYICEECTRIQMMDEDPTVTAFFPGLVEDYRKSEGAY